VSTQGRVKRARSYFRKDRVLPITGEIELLIKILQQESKLSGVMETLASIAHQNVSNQALAQIAWNAPPALEAMIHDGWVKASYDRSLPLGKILRQGTGFRWNRDEVL